MIEKDGEERVREMMAALGTREANIYRERCTGEVDLEILVEFLNEMGWFVEIVLENGNTLIKSYNCLFYEVSKEFGEIICAFDLSLIETILNQDVWHRASMARRDRFCSFLIARK